MKLKVIGTGSKGNAYLLENENEALLIECGMNINAIKKALDFNLSKLVGCLVTHEHKDHSKAISEVLASGIPVWASGGTHKACGTGTHHRARLLQPDLKKQVIGNFEVMAFDVRHDAEEPVGFLINHEETGNLLFLTDTFYCPYTFKGLNNIIIETNFSNKIMRERLSDKEFLRNRILTSHMSLETAIGFLHANDLGKVNNIVLIHLSDTNSNEALFVSEIKKVTGKQVTVASNGLIMELNKTPF